MIRPFFTRLEPLDMTEKEWYIWELNEEYNKRYLKYYIAKNEAVKIYKNKEKTKYTIISKSFKKGYNYRLTNFDSKGPVCHYDRISLEEITNETYEEINPKKKYLINIEVINF